jgi:large subunit ribosomal protein LP0
MVVSDRKKQYFEKLVKLLATYEKVLIIGADNVGSNQMQQVRTQLRGKGIVLMGKNTMVRKAIKSNLEANPNAAKLLPYIKGNMGFIFVEKNADIAEIRAVIAKNKVAAHARVGAVAPVQVTVPAGSTGLEPTKTSFFQALNIPTKITKGSVEITTDVVILRVGDKVGSSEATLLQMLNIKPFMYGLEILVVYEGGSLYSAGVLDLTDADYKNYFETAVSRLTGLSLGAGYGSMLSAPHTLRNGFQNLLAVSVATDYTIKQAEDLKDRIANPDKYKSSAAAPAAKAAAPAAAGKPAAAAAPAKEEEPEEDMGFGLFD